MMPHYVRIILNHYLVIVILIASISGQKYYQNPIVNFEKEIQLIEDIISNRELFNISSRCVKSLKSLSLGSREGDESSIKGKSLDYLW